MPINSMIPISAIRLNGAPNSSSASSAPRPQRAAWREWSTGAHSFRTARPARYNRGNSRQNQNHLRVHGVLEHLRRTGKAAAHGGGHPELGHGAVDGLAGLRQRRAGGQVKRDGRGRRKPLVVHRQRGVRPAASWRSTTAGSPCRRC